MVMSASSAKYIDRNAHRTIYPTQKGILVARNPRTQDYKIAVLNLASTSATVGQAVELLEELFEYTPTRAAGIVKNMIRMRLVAMHNKAYDSRPNGAGSISL